MFVVKGIHVCPLVCILRQGWLWFCVRSCFANVCLCFLLFVLVVLGFQIFMFATNLPSAMVSSRQRGRFEAAMANESRRVKLLKPIWIICCGPCQFERLEKAREASVFFRSHQIVSELKQSLGFQAGLKHVKTKLGPRILIPSMPSLLGTQTNSTKAFAIFIMRSSAEKHSLQWQLLGFPCQNQIQKHAKVGMQAKRENQDNSFFKIWLPINASMVVQQRSSEKNV